MAYLSPQGRVYDNYCEKHFEDFDTLKKIFTQHPKRDLVKFEEIMVEVKSVASDPGSTVYHNATCKTKRGSSIRKVSLQSILGDDTITLMRCCENLPGGTKSSLLTLRKVAKLFSLHDLDFEDLELYEKDVILEEFEHTELAFSRISQETPFDVLYESTISLVSSWKKIFLDYLESAEGTTLLLDRAMEKLNAGLGTSLNGNGEVYSGLRALSREHALQMAQAIRSHPGFALCSKSEGFRVEDFGSGSFGGICLQRWGGAYENISVLPLVIFEWLSSIEEAYPESVLFLDKEPDAKVLETTARLFDRRRSGAYHSIDKAYAAAQALEEQ